MWPLIRGTNEQFRLVQNFLSSSSYNEETLCKRLVFNSLAEVDQTPEIAPDRCGSDLSGLLMRLFFAGDCLQIEALQPLIPRSVMEAFNTLGLIAELGLGSGRLFAPVALYPAHGLYLTSDRWTRPGRRPVESFNGIILPAIGRHACQLIDSLPDSPCRNFLDLCSDAGVVALAAASRYAEHAWAADLSERATQCAEFNRRLAGLDNVTLLTGGRNKPLPQTDFDRIVAHSSLVCALRPATIRSDGDVAPEETGWETATDWPEHLSSRGSRYDVAVTAQVTGLSTRVLTKVG